MNPSPGAAAAFDQARRAYRVLMDRASRAKVDAERSRVSGAGGTFTWANIAAAGGVVPDDDELGSAFDAVFGGG